MAWNTPTLVEICIGLEINGYLPAELTHIAVHSAIKSPVKSRALTLVHQPMRSTKTAVTLTLVVVAAILIAVLLWPLGRALAVTSPPHFWVWG